MNPKIEPVRQPSNPGDKKSPVVDTSKHPLPAWKVQAQEALLALVKEVESQPKFIREQVEKARGEIRALLLRSPVAGKIAVTIASAELTATMPDTIFDEPQLEEEK